MLDLPKARKVAEAALAQYSCVPEDELVILDQHTIAKPYGWVFFFNSREFLATHDLQYAVVGGPLVVDRETGSVAFVGAAQGVDNAIGEFEQRRYGKRFDAFDSAERV